MKNFKKVMTGAAAQELGNKEQALAAFQRAIQISPNQAPVWQVKPLKNVHSFLLPSSTLI
jgi:tetratricopeptide (TPR) repeat protein